MKIRGELVDRWDVATELLDLRVTIHQELGPNAKKYAPETMRKLEELRRKLTEEGA